MTAQVETEHHRRFVWRCWSVTHDGLLQSPLGKDFESRALVWPPGGETDARCEAGRHHEPPAAECSCGIRGVLHLPHFLAGARIHGSFHQVVGIAELRGQIEDRDAISDPRSTVRAATGRVAGPLFLYRGLAHFAQLMANAYGIDVIVGSSEDQLEWLDPDHLERDVALYGTHPDKLRKAARLYCPDGTDVTAASARRVQSLTPDDRSLPDWDEIVPGLWQGSCLTEPTGEDFDAVVTLWDGAAEVGEDVEELFWPIEDAAYPPPDPHGLDGVVDWLLTRWEAGARCLVRSRVGANRAGLVVGRALVDAGTAPRQALRLIHTGRGQASLHNATFRALVLGMPFTATPRWGVDGSAGILCRRPSDGRYLLLHCSDGTFLSWTWGLPGGFLFPGEEPWHAAMRESRQQIGALPADLHPIEEHGRRDGDGWRHTTYVVEHEPRPQLDRRLHDQSKWVTAEDAAALYLHPDVVPAWEALTGQPLQQATSLEDYYRHWVTQATATNRLLLQLRSLVRA